MKHLRLVWALGIALCLVVAPASEASASRQEARAAFKKGRLLFKEGKYAAAVAALKKAYALSPHPALLRYLGQTYYKWNKPKEALVEFERYIKEAPQAPDRANVEAKIAEIKKVMASGSGGASGDETPGDGAGTKGSKIDLRPTGEDKEMPDVFKGGHRRHGGVPSRGGTGGFLTIAKWTSVGLAAAGLAMGITFNVMAQGKADDLEAAVTASNPDKNKPTVSYNKDHHNMQQAYKRDNTVAIISYVVGGVFTAAAVALFFFDGDDKVEKKSPAVPSGGGVAIAPAVGPGFYGVAGTVTF